MDKVKTQEVQIVNKLGLHARAAAKLVKTASQFQADIKLAKGDKPVDAKNIMSVLMLAAGKETKLELTADGPDENEAVTAISDLIANRFEESE